MFMILEIERFIVVVDKGSFTKASRQLYLTQPALSLSIKRLEEVLRVKLFKRIGKKLILTKDGEAVYRIGKRILLLWEKALSPNSRRINPTAISIGLFDNAALKLTKYFQKNLKKHQFEITIDRSAALMQAMQNGLFDICICVFREGSFLEKDTTVVATFFEKLIPVSGKPWKRKTKDIPFILYNSDSATRNYIDEVFIKRNIKPNIIVESTSPAFMKNLAMGGFGVALLPENFVETEIKQKKLLIQKFPFEFKRKIGVFLSKESNLKKENKLIQEVIKNLK